MPGLQASEPPCADRLREHMAGNRAGVSDARVRIQLVCVCVRYLQTPFLAQLSPALMHRQPDPQPH
eukprot:2558340-Rhodomonas_salina.2